MESADNGGVVESSLQMLHVHVLLVAPLGAGHMAESGTDQHKGRIAIRESAHHPSAAADLSVEPFDHIVGADSSPVFVGEFAIGQCFLYTVLDLFAASFSFISRSWAITSSAFSRAALLLSWAWIALSILATSFTLERGTTENTLR